MQTIIDNDISLKEIENEIEKQGLAKKDLKELAHMMMLSLTSIQNTYRKHRDNFNVDAFLADVQKINPYSKSVEAVPFTFFNGFLLNAISDQKIKNYAVTYIDDDADYTPSHILKREKELYTLYNAGQFRGLTWSEYILYCAIMSILSRRDEGEQVITLQEIWTALYPSCRWDKSSLEHRYNLLRSIRMLNNKINNPDTGIGGFSYVAGGKNKIKIGTKKPIPARDFLGFCAWQHINDWDAPEGENGISYSLRLQQEEEFNSTKFTAQKGIYINIINNQKRCCTIPHELLVARNVKNNIAVNYYIVRHILLSLNTKNNIKPVILFSTLEKYFGAVSRDCIKKIMENAKNKGLINNYVITAKKIDFSNYDDKKITIMKNEKKEVVEAQPPHEITERELKIRELNHYYSKHNITLNGKTLSTDLRQIFNTEWSKGGRLYTTKGGYQAVRSSERKNIKIDGKETTELDFSCCQINLLYAYRGMQAPDDCYSFFHDRELAKLTLNIAINAKNKSSAIQAIMNNWNAKNDKKITLQQADELINMAMEAHPDIYDYICSGAGVGLQYIDSNIALAIASRCKREGIIALPVHDSFICPASEAGKLKNIMNEEYKEYTGGFTCPIK